MILYRNDTALIGLIAEGTSNYFQKNFVPMLPAPMHTPAFELQQSVIRETTYHDGN